MKSKTHSEERTPAPPWSMRAFQEFLADIERIDRVLVLSVRGISLVEVIPKVVENIQDVLGTEKTAENFAHARISARDATLANIEVKTDFALLHSQAIVALWGSLETLMSEFAKDWVLNSPNILTTKPWSELKVKIGDYEPLDDDQRASYLVSPVVEFLASPLKKGVDKFELLTHAVGLGGSVDRDVKKALYEFHQTRNAIVHNRGIADKKFCIACPWIAITAGNPIRTDRKVYKRFFSATHEYIIELICRTGELYGQRDIRKKADHFPKELP